MDSTQMSLEGQYMSWTVIKYIYLTVYNGTSVPLIYVKFKEWLECNPLSNLFSMSLSSISFKAILHSALGLQLKSLWLIEWLALHSKKLSRERQERPQRGPSQPTSESAFVRSFFQTSVLQYHRCLSFIKEMTCCRLITGKLPRHHWAMIIDGGSDVAFSFHQELAASSSWWSNGSAFWRQLNSSGVGVG